jgi:hypothetical protein
VNIDICRARPGLGEKHGGWTALLPTLALMLCPILPIETAGAAGAMENYQFLPVPAVVELGTSFKLTMAGCVDPAATVESLTCPAPTVLADSMGAEAGTLRQTAPVEFVYTAPTVMPAHNMVEIHANYQKPKMHEVFGTVMLVAPKLVNPKTAAAGPKKDAPPDMSRPIRYTGFVKVFAAPPGMNGSWQLNTFWLEGESDAHHTAGGPGVGDRLYVNFTRLVASMSALRIDEQGRSHYSEGKEVFEGEFEVFSHLNINVTKRLYGWQAHGDKLGGRPPTSTTYMDPGYNSSCGGLSFNTGKETTLPYKDLSMLSGALDCGREKEEGYGPGVVMSWYFVPLNR